MSLPMLKYREPAGPQDVLTEAVPRRPGTEGSPLNLARASLLGVPLSKVEDLLRLFRSYRGGRPNSLIRGGPMGWSWYSTLDADHHGSLTGPTGAHRHSDLASISSDDHHARDHASRHDPAQADALSTAYFRTDGSLGMTGNLKPGADATRDIGEAAWRFRDLRLSRSIYLGGAQLKWETADADAAVLMADLPAGGPANVPVAVFGQGIAGVDLGWFHGIAQTALAVVNQARNAYVALGFNAGGAAVLTTSASSVSVRKLDDSAFPVLVGGYFDAYYGFRFQADAIFLDARNADNAWNGFRARDTGGGLAEVARLQGGAPATFDLARGRLTGDLNANSRKITALGAPAADTDAPRARAGDILSGRFGMARMPSGTSGYVLTAQGAGADPAYQALSAAAVTSGSYTGNDTANRAIAHGLGVIPRAVLITYNRAGVWFWGHIFAGVSGITGHLGLDDTAGTARRYPVTAMGTAYFYVGDAADYNKSGNGTIGSPTYYWVAMA